MAEAQPQAKVSGDLHNITVEELYDKEKYDLSTMEQQDVMQLLQYVAQNSNALLFYASFRGNHFLLISFSNHIGLNLAV
jgi:hypothetical protein